MRELVGRAAHTRRIGLQERTGSRSTATHTALHYDITGV